MRIAHLSTWHCRCGIAEYCELLVHYLGEIHPEGQLVESQVVLGNWLTAKSKLLDYKSIAPQICWPLFRPTYLEGEWWGEGPERITLALQDCDLLHIQLQTNLYDVYWLTTVMTEAKRRGMKTVATFHDSGVWPEFRWDLLDAAVAHRADTMASFPLRPEEKPVIERGIPAVNPWLCSFAFGRNPHREVGEALRAIDVNFTARDHTDWVGHAELIDWIRQYDGVVLFYPDVGASVSSGALRTALAARRPCFVSDTTWFREAASPLVKKYQTLPDLVEGVRSHFSDPMIDRYHYREVAKRHQALYQSLLETR
jgi:hypothetical protein